MGERFRRQRERQGTGGPIWGTHVKKKQGGIVMLTPSRSPGSNRRLFRDDITFTGENHHFGEVVAQTLIGLHRTPAQLQTGCSGTAQQGLDIASVFLA